MQSWTGKLVVVIVKFVTLFSHYSYCFTVGKEFFFPLVTIAKLLCCYTDASTLFPPGQAHFLIVQEEKEEEEATNFQMLNWKAR